MGSANNQEFFFKIVIKIFWLKDIYIYSLETKTCITVEEAWKEHHIKFNQDKFEMRQRIFLHDVIDLISFFAQKNYSIS